MKIQARVQARVKAETIDELKAYLQREGEAIMAGMAQLQVANIKRRLKLGHDLDDKQMPPYTPSYERWKRKRGRNTSKRDLTFRGHLQRGMVAIPNGRGRWVIRFTDPLQRIKAQRHQELAPWFGVSPEDFLTLSRWLREYLAR